MATNLDNISVDSSGRIQFSGISSKIDFKAAVDSIIAAKRIPVDSLEKKIDERDLKIAAYQDFRGKLNGLKESLGTLYGAITADKSKNIFEAKQAFASSSRKDGGSASAPTDLVGVTVSNLAAAGSHTIEVLRTARSHRVGSGGMSATNVDLGTARGLGAGTIAGKFTIKGVEINVSANDTLLDLASRINNANSGPSATGVSASIVRASATESYLVLNVDKTGTALGGADLPTTDTDGVLAKLGVMNGGGTFANELQAPQTAQFHADGLTDPSKFRSASQASVSTALNLAGTLNISDGSGTPIGSVAYSAGISLEGLRDAINGDGALNTAGISASIESVGGKFMLRIEDAGGEAFSIADTGNAVSTLGIAKAPLLLERSSNTVTDVFDGVTLSLFQAEAGTTVKIDVERNLTAVKTAVEGFVTSYNAARQFLNEQLDTDPTTGKPREDAVLYGSSTLSAVERSLSQIVGSNTEGVSDAFSVMAQIGIGFVDNKALQDTSLSDTLKIDSAKLDSALLNNALDVQKLFAFGFSSSDPSITAVGFDGRTSFKESGYSIDIAFDAVGQAVTGATVPDGTATAAGRLITLDSGPAAGLRLFYGGSTDVTNARLDVTVGLGAKMFFEIESLLDSRSGTLESEIENLGKQNTLAQKRVDEMTVRLDLKRAALTAQFIRMETALAQMKTIMDSVGQMTDAMFQDR